MSYKSKSPVGLRAGTAMLRLAFAATGACAWPAQAQTAAAEAALAPVVVTASRIEQALSEALPATSVITREDIERSQANNLIDLLRRAPGVELAQLGGLGHQSSLLLRGTESRHTLVLVDGVPINNLNFSTASIEQIPVDQIDRIEIVRGNVSALYGAQAVGGVIQVFTRRGDGPTALNASVSAGSRATREARAGIDGAQGGLRYSAQIARITTDGFNAIKPEERPETNPDLDGYENTSGSAQVSYAFNADHELGARWLRTRGVVDYDSEFGPSTQQDQSTQTIETVSAYSRNRLAPIWTSTLNLADSRDKLDANITAYPYYVTSKGQQASWQNDLALAEHWTLTLAAEHLRQTIDSDTTYSTTKRTIDTLRAGTVGQIGAHQVQVNARNDDYSDFGNHSTWYAGYGYALDAHWKLTASASTAFNAPTFNDLFYPWGGNPDLKPEKSRAKEVGVQYAQGATLVRAVAFSTRISDLIGNDASFNRANIDRAKIEGLEVSASTTLAAWRVQAALTVQSPKDESTDQRLIRRAKQFGSLAVSRSIAAWELETVWHLSGDRLDAASGTRHTLGGYGRVDLAARWQFAPHWSLGLRAENVFDKDYETAYGYASGGRAAFATLSYSGR